MQTSNDSGHVFVKLKHDLHVMDLNMKASNKSPAHKMHRSHDGKSSE